CTWWDILAAVKTMDRFEPAQVAEIESFLHDPHGWSKANGGASQMSE
ncbi:MAG: orotate phosphoribosyltransferase, partial [Rhizobiales bacterium 32-66-8]